MTDFSRLARKITWVLFANQSLASAGFIASATINSIIGANLGGNASWAGVPSAVYLLGAAFAASAWGYLMDRIGRRNGIVFGLIIGVIGNALVLYAIASSSLLMFLIGMILMGITNAAVTLGRFAAAEVNPPEMRGAAISNVVLGGTFGAIVGPLLVGPMGNYIKTLGMDELAGAYLATLILFVIAAVIVFAGLRPDPRDLGVQIAEQYPDSAPTGEARSILEIFRQPAALVAVTAMALGQVVMVAIMVITSLHMRDHQHHLGDISAVIASHTFGMFAFSVISGRLTDKWGRGPVILVGASTLLLACITAPLSPDVLPLAVSLFLLGLGWNFCFVGGSALLSDQLSPLERSRTQGANDLFVGLASAVGSLGSGFVFAGSNYTVISIVAGVIALVPLMMSMLWMRKKVAVVPA
ncbi:MAG: MFS transporter [Anaerolineae bacterium]|nr:MFS transporter [Anaerolineae bacterium]MCI0608975.1 MFS transporter [Anaerolineae bacterium]